MSATTKNEYIFTFMTEIMNTVDLTYYVTHDSMQISELLVIVLKMGLQIYCNGYAQTTYMRIL